MIPLGMVITFAGYGISSWGWVLVKGYNITLREWFTPLHPFAWPPPGTAVPTVPRGHLFPTTAPAAGEGSGGPVQPGGHEPTVRPHRRDIPL